MIVDGDPKTGIIQETGDDFPGHRRQDIHNPNPQHRFFDRPRDILVDGLNRYVL